jgi:PhnB protein
MRFQPQLTFNGECEAAFNLYERCFGGTITSLVRYGEAPMAPQTAPALHDKIMHATLTVGDSRISGADVPAEAYKTPTGFEVLLNLDDAAQAERIFTMLADGGVVRAPMQQTFWALRFGMVVDRFGTPWTINCGTPA